MSIAQCIVSKSLIVKQLFRVYNISLISNLKYPWIFNIQVIGFFPAYKIRCVFFDRESNICSVLNPEDISSQLFRWLFPVFKLTYTR